MTEPIKYETIWHGIPMVVEYGIKHSLVSIVAISSKLDHSVVVLSRADMEELKRKCGKHYLNILKPVMV